MSALTPWDPFRELDELQNRLATMFGRIPQRQGARTGNEAMTTADWAPMADISEDENAFLLKLDLPEVPKDAVRVSAENGVLTISGERKLEKEEQGKKFHRIERVYGRFVRSFVLPDNVDPTKVTASMKDGVLEVRLVKAEQAKPKQIEISVN
ncbi:small heat shock protein sHSP20-GI [Pseudomonas aeruginosa]|uniref:small heat shock protein sHSP20-GI n=1 Tax=Gammaproteobacteria TaxID=1236 RepID=UPI00053D3E4C|nr:small heat shock protein sHSP20-GI [Pseudomonas aeruginosa]